MYNAFISYSHAADDKFAPSLQDALQKFAKPWYKKRNLEIFRDESSLSASPHLWNNITKALEQSEYLMLLASSLSENSHWVNEEVKYWLEHKSVDNILLVLTEGEITWDVKNKKFLNPDNNSLPPALDNVFKDEPFYIDLRQSKTYEDLSLDNPIFKKEILKLAAKLHNKQPNDLASDEVTVHRRWVFLRNTVMSIVGLLLIVMSAAFWLANVNRKEAEAKTKLAIENETKAKNNLRQFKEEEFRRNLKNGKTYLEAEEYYFAKLDFDAAMKTAVDTAFNKGISQQEKSELESAIKLIPNFIKK